MNNDIMEAVQKALDDAGVSEDYVVYDLAHFTNVDNGFMPMISKDIEARIDSILCYDIGVQRSMTKCVNGTGNSKQMCFFEGSKALVVYVSKQMQLAQPTAPIAIPILIKNCAKNGVDLILLYQVINKNTGEIEYTSCPIVW